MDEITVWEKLLAGLVMMQVAILLIILKMTGV